MSDKGIDRLKKDSITLAPMRGRKQWVFYIIKMACRIFLQPFFRIRAEGGENIPHGRAYVLLPKHQRWEDIPLLDLAAERPLHYVAKHELFKNGILNWFFRSLGGIPLNRKNPLESRNSLLAIVTVLQKGEGVVVFPEGTYYSDTMGPGHVGIIRYILSRLSVAFIPVGVKYSRQWPRTLIRVRFGRALYADSATPAEQFLDVVMKKIAELSELSYVRQH